MTKETFTGLSEQGMLEYVNERLKNGGNAAAICREFDLSRNYITKRLTGYKYNRTIKQYEPKAGSMAGKKDNYKPATKVADEAESEQLDVIQPQTTKQLQNNYSVEEYKSSQTVVDPNMAEMLKVKKDLLELAGLKSDIQEMLEWYALNSSVVETPSLAIDSDEFKGDLKPRSFKLYENVRSELSEFLAEHKSFKAQDIVNKAILEFVRKYKK